jgi:hypothetical protein
MLRAVRQGESKSSKAINRCKFIIIYEISLNTSLMLSKKDKIVWI